MTKAIGALLWSERRMARAVCILYELGIPSNTRTSVLYTSTRVFLISLHVVIWLVASPEYHHERKSFLDMLLAACEEHGALGDGKRWHCRDKIVICIK